MHFSCQFDSSSNTSLPTSKLLKGFASEYFIGKRREKTWNVTDLFLSFVLEEKIDWNQTSSRKRSGMLMKK